LDKLCKIFLPKIQISEPI